MGHWNRRRQKGEHFFRCVTALPPRRLYRRVVDKGQGEGETEASGEYRAGFISTHPTTDAGAEATALCALSGENGTPHPRLLLKARAPFSKSFCKEIYLAVGGSCYSLISSSRTTGHTVSADVLFIFKVRMY